MSRCYQFILSLRERAARAASSGTLSLSIVFVLLYSLPAIATPLSSGSMTQSGTPAFFNWGVDKIRTGNYKEAVADFTQAIQHRANFAAAYSNRCLAHIQLGDYQSAITDCTQAVSLTPNNIEAYLNRGLAHYRLSHHQAAIADAERVIKLNPHEFRAYYNRGVARAELGHHTAAIDDYDRALRQIPQFSSPLMGEIYNDRGLARFSLSDLTGALADFSQAIRLNANDDRAHYNRGCVCGRQRNYKVAVQDFTVSLQLNPNNAEAYLNRGIARHELGYQQLALMDLQQAAKHFAKQGKPDAYQQTLHFIRALQQELVSFPVDEIG